jgi:hypothetical protein
LLPGFPDLPTLFAANDAGAHNSDKRAGGKQSYAGDS